MDNNFQTEIEALLEQMTLDEKIGMIHADGLFHSAGVPRLGIPGIAYSDGPMGVRQEFQNDKWRTACTTEDMVTYLPSNSALAATWNRELAYGSGQVLGEEARGRGKDVILAPGINIKRSPLCGRNFEYMSEDPYLVEELVVPFIRGVQENDVAACVKHFAVNTQETDRLYVDSQVDERTLMELYLPGFKAAVRKAQSWSIMGAYNKLNGTHCCENRELLGEVLRKKWNYDGVIVSDWGGVHRTKETAESPLDVEMSVTDKFDDYFLAKPLKKLIEEGTVSEECVNEKVRNLLRLMFRLKMIGPDKDVRKAGAYNTPAHREAVYRTAAESVIILKNEQDTLPLTVEKEGASGRRIAVIGRNAEMIHANGGGSAEIKALYEISPLMGLKNRLGGNVTIWYAPGYYIPKKEAKKEENWQQDSLSADDFLSPGKQDEIRKKEAEKLAISKEKGQALLQEALRLAAEADEVIFIGGLNHDYDVEGQDRSSMKLPYDQDTVIEELLKIRPDMPVVLIAGSPVEMPWRDRARAIVWSYYAGMEGGNALADVILGNINPSGKLPESMPVCYEDTVTGENGQFALTGAAKHEEGILVGYRYYEKKDKAPAFCFGHGLSYTTYDYKALTLSVQEGETKVLVSFRLKNTGSRSGRETVQVYVSEKEPALPRPVKELKGFAKIALEAGEEKEVTFCLGPEAFGYYDVERKSFAANAGTYRILIGASCKDIRLQGEAELTGEAVYD